MLAGLIVTALKIAIIFMILAGLIFRTKETLGLLLVLGVWSLFTHYPLICLSVLGMLGILAIYRAWRKKDVPALPPPSTDREP